jgi:hypothetical protein
LHALEDFDGRKVDMHASEPLVPVPRPFEVEIAVEKLKMYKLPRY